MATHRLTIEYEDTLLPYDEVKIRADNDFHIHNIKYLKRMLKTLVRVGSLVPSKPLYHGGKP